VPALASRRQLWSSNCLLGAEFRLGHVPTIRNSPHCSLSLHASHEDDIELVETNHAIGTWAWEGTSLKPFWEVPMLPPCICSGRQPR
jgi:hypothetical protein